MSMEDKVADEIQYDEVNNEGALFRQVLGGVALYGPELQPGDAQYAAIRDVLQNESEARIVFWHRAAVATYASMKPEEQARLKEAPPTPPSASVLDFNAAKARRGWREHTKKKFTDPQNLA